MEGEGHDAVRRPEGLFDTIAMMNVDVYVEDSGMVKEELKDSEDDVVDVAEAASFRLFGMVQAAGPVDCNLGLARGEFSRGIERGAGVETTVLIETVEDGTIVTKVEGRVGSKHVVKGSIEGSYAGEPSVSDSQTVLS